MHQSNIFWDGGSSGNNYQLAKSHKLSVKSSILDVSLSFEYTSPIQRLPAQS